MILSAHQPAYLPWLGYFDKIARSDVFVYLDTVQFEKNSFINRNQIKTPQGALWLTIPVKSRGHMEGTLLSTEIDDSQPWRRKHLKSIEMNYRKSQGFDRYFSKIEKIINISETNISDYCFQQLMFWCQELNIKTKIVRSSTLPINSTKSNLVLDLCKQLKADNYLSGLFGKNYLIEKDFESAGVKIEYQNYNSPIYSQLWGGFVPNLGVVDAWMNQAPMFR